MERVKVLFVGRTFAHFSYYESIISALMDAGAEVEYSVDQQWSGRWDSGDVSLQEFLERYPGLKFSWAVRRSDHRREALFAARELRSFRSYLVRPETTPFYINRWRAYLPPEQKKAYDSKEKLRRLKSPLSGLGLRAQEALAPPDRCVMGDILNKAPDVIVVSPANMRFSEEIEYIKAARKLGIPTALPVYSWDNLSTKGLIHVTPDVLFVWNEYQLEDARQIHDIPPSKIRVVGSPFFDKWFAPPSDPLSREAFCARIGFDPARKILLYLGSSKNIAKDESWFVEEVAAALAESPSAAVREAQILIRPHPANFDVYRRLTESGLKVWPENGALPETRQDFADMRNSFEHADAALGINTSGMIDSVLADLPTFSVKLPRYAQTQADSKHFRYLEEGGAMYLPQDLPAFAETFAEVMAGTDPKAADRREFARRFARPQGLDRSAGEVIAEQVLAMGRAKAAGRGRRTEEVR
jgi:hypothetical protein